MKLRAYNIQYDLEGSVPPHQVKEVLDNLPKEIIVETLVADATEDEFEELISETISDETGFCHKGFEWEMVDDTKELFKEIDHLLTDIPALFGSLFMFGILNDKLPIYPEIKKMKDQCDSIREKIKGRL